MADTLGLLYDYGSILHYGEYEYAIDDSVPTLEPKNPDDAGDMGQRIQLSADDVTRIRTVYGC